MSVLHRVHTYLLGLRTRWRARHERTLTTSYEGLTIHYPELSIIGQAIASGKSWQGSLGAVLEAVLPVTRSPVVVEVGSNIGASLIEIKRRKPDAMTFCFEPSDRFADLLERNVRENDLRGVTIERVLVGRNAGSAQLYVNSSTASVATADYGGHHLLGVEATPMVTLDDYFGAGTSIDFLKIDTDGFDSAVVAGGRNVITRDAPVIYCEFAPFLLEETGESGEDFLALLRDLGYATIFPVVDGGQVLAAAADDAGLLAAADRERYVDLVAVHDRRPEQAAALERIAAGAG